MAWPTHPRKAEAEALLRSGLNPTEVGRRVGVSQPTVRIWAMQLDAEPRSKTTPEAYHREHRPFPQRIYPEQVTRWDFAEGVVE